MNKTIEILLRLIAFPFMAAVVLIHHIRIYITVMLGYLIYGGEAIMYSKKVNKKRIYEVFLKVSEMVNNEQNEKKI